MYAVLLIVAAIAHGPGMAVEIRETGPGPVHAVYVYPTWVRPGSVAGPHFGAPITPADISVQVPTPSGGSPCFHFSGSIPYNTQRYVRLSRDAFCEATDLPVARLPAVQAAYLGMEMECPNWTARSAEQPRGIRSFWCDFR